MVVAKVPGPGTVDILVTTGTGNLVRTAQLLAPGPGQFVFARARATASTSKTLSIRVNPSTKGRQLVRHHRHRITLRMWVTYIPSDGLPRSTVYYDLHLP